MKCFSSTLLKAGQNVDLYSTSKSMKQALVDSFNNAMNQGQEAASPFDDKNGNKNFNLKLDFNNSTLNSTIKERLIDEVNTPTFAGGSDNNTRSVLYRKNDNVIVENPLKFSSDVLNAINKYRFIFKNATRVNSVMYTVTKKNEKGKIDKSTGDNMYIDFIDSASTPALFNPWYSVSAKGFSATVPLSFTVKDKMWHNFDTEGTVVMDKDINDVDGEGQKMYDNATGAEEIPGTVNGKDGKSDVASSYKTKIVPIDLNIDLAPGAKNIDVSDCSIDTLVKLSEGKATSTDGKISELGVAKYRYIDFMFCRDLGKISNNHLLTLRKFTKPVGDNIHAVQPKADTPYNFNQAMDVGRLVTWFGNGDNKLEDIIKYNYVATFKKFESKIQEVDSEEDSESTGIIGKIANTFNPRYNSAMSAGRTGSHNFTSSFLGGKLNKAFDGKIGDFSRGGQYDRHKIFGKYDQNKIYEPQNTIQETHQYEGKLQFTHDFTLKFAYRLRAYDNINPKAAFLDLLGNILAVTYRNGTFWGGSRMFKGAPANKTGTAKMNAFLDRSFDTLGGLGNSLMSGNLDFGGMLASVWGAVKSIVSDAANVASDILTGGNGKQLQKDIKGGNIKGALGTIMKGSGLWQGIQGMIKNGLGRPAVYALDSLLSGDNVGLWHLTIGNPRNPIMCIGNLIIDKSEIIQSGPLGLDDFPTELTVSISLKHGRPRDSAEIQKMYTKGLSPIYTALGAKAATRFYNLFTNGVSKVKEATDNSYNTNITMKEFINKNNEYLAQNPVPTTPIIGNPLTLKQEIAVSPQALNYSNTEKLVYDMQSTMLSGAAQANVNEYSTSWIYAELGDYMGDVIQTSIELSGPSGEEPLTAEEKNEIIARAGGSKNEKGNGNGTK